jgi:hypothetical protein
MRRTISCIAVAAALLMSVAPLVLGYPTEVAVGSPGGPAADPSAEPSPADILQLHQLEITFHQAGTTKDLPLMLSLFADDATLTSGGKTYSGKEEVRAYWTNAGPFLPQNHWAGYTPAYKIRVTVEGDRATLYFECLWVDAETGQVQAHTFSDDSLVRSGGRWLIKEMKAGKAPRI